MENCVRYLTCLQLVRDVEPADLPLLDAESEEQANEESGLADQSFQDAKRDLVNRFERLYLEDALRKSNGNIARAARASGKQRRAFFQLMRKHCVTTNHNGNGTNDHESPVVATPVAV